MSETELLTVAEFANRVRRNKATIYNWIRSGWLTPDDGLFITPSGGFLIDWLKYRERSIHEDRLRRRRSGLSHRSSIHRRGPETSRSDP